MRIIIDTNILISHFLLPDSLPSVVVSYSLRNHQLLASDSYLLELQTIFQRPKFDAYISLIDRQLFLLKLYKSCEMVRIIQTVRSCRDAKDDMILELALNGAADYIISGDKDLLTLHPYRNTVILTPREFYDKLIKPQ